MTKKDYELIARVFRENETEYRDQEAFRRDLAWELGNALGRDNPRLDRGKFLAACIGRGCPECAREHGHKMDCSQGRKRDYMLGDGPSVTVIPTDEPRCLNCEVVRLEAEQQ